MKWDLDKPYTSKVTFLQGYIGIVMLLVMLLCSYQYTYAQTGLLNPLPNSIKMDLANPQLPGFKKQYKQYKDTIDALTQLKKETLLAAAGDLNDLPVKDKNKVKIKNVRQKFTEYKGMVYEVDSLIRFRNKVDQIKKTEQFSTKRTSKANTAHNDISKLKQLSHDKKKIQKWMRTNRSNDGDTALTYDKLMSVEEDIPWQELGVDQQQFLDDYAGNQQYMDDANQMQKILNDSASVQKLNNYSQLTDKYFDDYDAYLEAKSGVKVAEAKLKQADQYQKDIFAILRGEFGQSNGLTKALAERAKKIKKVRDITNTMDKAEQLEQNFNEQVEELQYKADLKSQYEKHVASKTKDDAAKEGISKLKPLLTDKLKGNEKGMQLAQKGMDAYQKKYYKYQNANGEIIAEKKKSLKDRSFGERLKIGGYLQYNNKRDETSLDISPAIGYQVTSDIVYGIGGTYRVNLKSVRKADHKEFGFRTFTQYYMGPFFAHGEYEWISHAKHDDKTDTIKRIKSSGILLGIGGEYTMSKSIKGNMMVLYNFLHNEDSPYRSPFVFRVGFNLSK